VKRYYHSEKEKNCQLCLMMKKYLPVGGGGVA
jgi:hypothetical protein